MSERTDGDTAFPHLGLYRGADGNLHPTPTQHGGMSLRDWFAGQALSGFRPSQSFTEEKLAAWAYRTADAMLKERQSDE